MPITNGYATLYEIRERLTLGRRYVAATISFASSTKKISDTALGLLQFPTGARIRVQGSVQGLVTNDGYYTVATGGVDHELVVNETLVTQAAGLTITITDVTDVEDDAKLESMVEAISRALDDETGRRFFTTANDETRYYAATDTDVLFCPDDIISITTLKTDDSGQRTYATTWAATDYDLEPANAALDGRPYTRLRITPQGHYSFPILRKGVQLVGKFGYTTCPKRITEACLLLAEKLYYRKDAVFGVLSSPLGELKQIMKEDAEVRLLLAGFQRLEVLLA